jgi:hypothetical protein
VARDPGEWYAEKAAEAERLEAELAGARAVFEAVCHAQEHRFALVEAARAVVRRLERALELARYVGD